MYTLYVCESPTGAIQEILGGVVSLKLAVTLVTPLTRTVQVPVPGHPVTPLQPMKVESVTATAVRITEVLKVKLAEQVIPQLMPPVELVTVPLPFPARTTVRSYVLSTKVAVTVVSAVIGTVQLPVPEQFPPAQPMKVEPVAGVAVRVIGALNISQQFEGQLMPPGSPVTMPLPVPASVTISK